jgi:hypothetical protein
MNKIPASIKEYMQVQRIGEIKSFVSGTDSNCLIAHRTLNLNFNVWLKDHCPTYVIPVLPFAYMLGMMTAASEALLPELKVVGFKNIRVEKWVSFVKDSQDIRTEARIISNNNEQCLVEVRLLIYRESLRKELSRFEQFCSGQVLLQKCYSVPTEYQLTSIDKDLDKLSGPSYYSEGLLFHGPTFQLLKDTYYFRQSGEVISIIHNPVKMDVDDELVLPLVFDGMAQAIPIRCHENQRYQKFQINVYSGADKASRLWASFDYILILIPSGKLFNLPVKRKLEFLRDHVYVEGMHLSRFEGAFESRLSTKELRESDWLNGTIARIYLDKERELADYLSLPAVESIEWLTLRVVAKDLVAKRSNIHPSKVLIRDAESGVLFASQYEHLDSFSVLTWSKFNKEYRVIMQNNRKE